MIIFWSISHTHIYIYCGITNLILKYIFFFCATEILGQNLYLQSWKQDVYCLYCTLSYSCRIYFAYPYNVCLSQRTLICLASMDVWLVK